MSYRKPYNGSPWQQGSPPFGFGGYVQSYGVYSLSNQYAMMNSAYSQSQAGYWSMYNSGRLSQMNSMGYGALSRSCLYMNDRQDTKKPLACHVCKIMCSTPERFCKHSTSRTHTEKMRKVLALQRKKKQVLEASVKASHQVDNRDSSKKSSKKPGNWCTVCDRTFTGNFLGHRQTKEHRKKRDKKYPKCRPCKVGFSCSEEYKKHCKKEDHKLNSAKFKCLKNLACGSDDDEAAIEPVKIDESEKEEKDGTVVDPKEEETKDKTEDKNDEETEEKKEKKHDAKKSLKPKEPNPTGQSFVVSVQGYYCKLCRKFFKDAAVAKVQHCCSIMHNDAFKKAMKEAMEEEEERQRLADEQEKLEEGAAEITRIAAEPKDTDAKDTAEQTGGSEKVKMGAANGENEVSLDEEVDKDVKGKSVQQKTPSPRK